MNCGDNFINLSFLNLCKIATKYRIQQDRQYRRKILNKNKLPITAIDKIR